MKKILLIILNAFLTFTGIIFASATISLFNEGDFWSGFIGLIFTMAILILPVISLIKLIKKKDNKITNKKNNIICLNCGCSVSEDNKFCPECGNDLCINKKRTDDAEDIKDLESKGKQEKEEELPEFENKNKDRHEKGQEKIKNFTCKVSGVTFKAGNGENRQEIIKRVINEIFTDGIHEPYAGISNKEIKEVYFMDRVYYAEGTTIPSTELKLEYYNNKPTIKVFIGEGENKYDMGYINKNDAIYVAELLTEKTIHFIYTTITGGKYKAVEYDDEDNEKIVVNDDLTYGLNVTIRYKEKE